MAVPLFFAALTGAAKSRLPARVLNLSPPPYLLVRTYLEGTDMIVYATKVTLKKTVIGLLALAAVVWGITALAPRAVQTVSAEAGAASLSQKLKTNGERVDYLRAYGWEVQDTPTVEMEVQVPKEFDDAYTAYNQMQQKQGLDLEKYKGKRAMLYTYTLASYPGGKEGVTASLLLYKDKVIAADISAPEADGFTHGITEIPAES